MSLGQDLARPMHFIEEFELLLTNLSHIILFIFLLDDFNIDLLKAQYHHLPTTFKTALVFQAPFSLCNASSNCYANEILLMFSTRYLIAPLLLTTYLITSLFWHGRTFPHVHIMLYLLTLLV